MVRIRRCTSPRCIRRDGEAQFDFTHCGELKVTIAGQSYPHLLFQLILSHSGWRYAEVVAGETFLALPGLYAFLALRARAIESG